jgi:hypothetical protein
MNGYPEMVPDYRSKPLREGRRSEKNVKRIANYAQVALPNCRVKLGDAVDETKTYMLSPTSVAVRKR